ncbi:hypothetical protein AAVH_34496 [Aphelenchoides avenae]|nr:hypothetical protein AAVH_34496 [Aphelenchus avenae]
MTPEATFSKQPGGLPTGLEFHGQSYLYPFEDAGTRTCANQMVPFQYCICQYESVDRTKTHRALAGRLAHFMVGRVNSDLESHNVTNLCATLSLDVTRQIELVEWEPSARLNIFRVTFYTVPGQGRFWGYVRVEGNTTDTSESYTLLTRRLSRLDTYGDKAFCLPDSIAKSYCYCKELLETTSTTFSSSARA